MNLSKHEIDLVQNSWNVITPVSQQMGEEFYGKLFELHPDLKPMFKSDPKDQAMKLMFMLSYLVHRLASVDDMRAEISKLASRHKGYGTLNDHYKPVGEVLMWSLQRNLGELWTPETEVAWRKAYDLIATLMTEAQEA
jgi:hemoglobin-like flavoprotein